MIYLVQSMLYYLFVIQDVVEKLKSFAVSHKRSLCILAACGSLSTATLMQVGPGGQGVGVTLSVSSGE